MALWNNSTVARAYPTANDGGEWLGRCFCAAKSRLFGGPSRVQVNLFVVCFHFSNVIMELLDAIPNIFKESPAMESCFSAAIRATSMALVIYFSDFFVELNLAIHRKHSTPRHPIQPLCHECETHHLLSFFVCEISWIFFCDDAFLWTGDGFLKQNFISFSFASTSYLSIFHFHIHSILHELKNHPTTVHFVRNIQAVKSSPFSQFSHPNSIHARISVILAPTRSGYYSPLKKFHIRTWGSFAWIVGVAWICFCFRRGTLTCRLWEWFLHWLAAPPTSFPCFSRWRMEIDFSTTSSVSWRPLLDSTRCSECAARMDWKWWSIRGILRCATAPTWSWALSTNRPPSPFNSSTKPNSTSARLSPFR